MVHPGQFEPERKFYTDRDKRKFSFFNQFSIENPNGKFQIVQVQQVIVYAHSSWVISRNEFFACMVRFWKGAWFECNTSTFAESQSMCEAIKQRSGSRRKEPDERTIPFSLETVSIATVFCMLTMSWSWVSSKRFLNLIRI